MSNEFLGERRKGLEEAYFAEHNRELIARLRKKSGRAQEGAIVDSGDLSADATGDTAHLSGQPVMSLRPVQRAKSVRADE